MLRALLFLSMRPHPSSPLFPHTTSSRSSDAPEPIPLPLAVLALAVDDLAARAPVEHPGLPAKPDQLRLHGIDRQRPAQLDAPVAGNRLEPGLARPRRVVVEREGAGADVAGDVRAGARDGDALALRAGIPDRRAARHS